MCTPSLPNSSRLATAQPPAKAAPNTSALIRMAALTTVSTLSQLIRRPPVLLAVSGTGFLFAAAMSPNGGAGSSPNYAAGWSGPSGRVAAGLGGEEAGLGERGPDAADLGVAELDQGRPHHRAREPSEQHQRLLHAVVHVGTGLGIEHPGQRINPVIEPPRRREIAGLHGAEQRRLQIRDHAAAAGEQPLAAEHQ